VLCTSAWRCTPCAAAWSRRSDTSQSRRASDRFAAMSTNSFFFFLHVYEIFVFILIAVKAKRDNDAAHFDENVFWLHVSVKDPTAVKTRRKAGREKGKRSRHSY